MNAYFDDLGRRLAAAAAARGATIEAPRLDGTTADQLLRLAGVVAHSSERRFAPLSCFLAGIAAERLRAEGVLETEADVATFVADLRASLEGPA